MSQFVCAFDRFLCISRASIHLVFSSALHDFMYVHEGSDVMLFVGRAIMFTRENLTRLTSIIFDKRSQSSSIILAPGVCIISSWSAQPIA